MSRFNTQYGFCWLSAPTSFWSWLIFYQFCIIVLREGEKYSVLFIGIEVQTSGEQVQNR